MIFCDTRQTIQIYYTLMIYAQPVNSSQITQELSPILTMLIIQLKPFTGKLPIKKLLIHFTVDENKKPVGGATVFIWNSNEKCFYSQSEAWGPEGTVMNVHKLKK
ncbi:MAG TPA: hypothetical protein P5547_01960 [Spirochaetota bacterium]|nr:hypothetical protein [Spirochaetota bacterium]